MKTHELILRTIGGVAVVMAAGGFWYNLSTFPAVLENRVHDPEAPHLFPAFIIMSAICIVCYILLTIAGVDSLRGRTRLARMFIATLVFEAVYYRMVGMLWFMPKIGISVAAASGVANGGLIFQTLCLFPFWAPFVVEWAKCKEEELSYCSEHVTGDPQQTTGRERSAIGSLERFMVKRAILVWLWTFVFSFGSTMLFGVVMGTCVVTSISSGSEPTRQTMSLIMPWALMASTLLGCVGFVLGMLGLLPGTRRKS